MRLRLMSLFCSLFLGLATLAPSAFADSYTYTTTGCFSTCPNTTVTINDMFKFGQADARVAFNNIGSPTTVLGGTTSSLGSFTFSVLNAGTASYSGLFSLNVSFSAPQGTSGGPFLALLSGNVFGTAGGATITFNPTSQQFTSANGSSFILSLTMNPIQISSTNPTASVNATILPAPEGSSIAMLGVSGMVLLGAIKIKMKRAIG